MCRANYFTAMLEAHGEVIADGAEDSEAHVQCRQPGKKVGSPCRFEPSKGHLRTGHPSYQSPGRGMPASFEIASVSAIVSCLAK
jgi:hypothetical protein